MPTLKLEEDDEMMSCAHRPLSQVQKKGCLLLTYAQ
jgi:hypothetical protein